MPSNSCILYCQILLCSAEVLHTSVYSKPFVVYTDASDNAVGAILSQGGANGEKADQFLSQNNFDVIVLRRDIRLYTDQNSPLNVQRHDITVFHRSGGSNSKAACLSHMDYESAHG